MYLALMRRARDQVSSGLRVRKLISLDLIWFHRHRFILLGIAIYYSSFIFFSRCSDLFKFILILICPNLMLKMMSVRMMAQARRIWKRLRKTKACL